MKPLLVLLVFLLSVSSSFATPRSIECIAEGKNGPEKIVAELLEENVGYPESPTLIDQTLYYVEFSKDQVVRKELGATKKVFWSRKGCGPAAVTHYLKNDFLVACYNDNSIVHLSETGQVIETFRESTTGTFKGPNDFTSDGQGGIYFTASGVFQLSAPIEGEIYHLNPNGIKKVASHIHYSNGIALLGDSLIVSEHFKNRILKYKLLKNGDLSLSPQVFADISSSAPEQKDLAQGYQGPDGVRVSGDLVYVAQFGGARVLKYSREGDYVGMISFDASFPNTDNVWFEDQWLYVSLFKELGFKERSTYPGMIIRLHDPFIQSRRNLHCQWI